ncbi:FAD:protein FMN transferase [candidate division KSB1 bacterium]|nr:FAD:protein FMN transferase [candidate division KSB1 bacterium]
MNLKQAHSDNGHNLITADIHSAAHRFSHFAMNTIFEIYIAHEDKSYAGQAALEAFKQVDRLEADLSRFIENSDISRINRAAALKPVRVCLDTFYCLEECEKMYGITFGVFDVTIGSLIACFFDKNKNLRQPTAAELAEARAKTGFSNLMLDRENLTVTLKKSGICLDLGGYGKGYAVDKIFAELVEWDIKNALVHGGASSVYATGTLPERNGWPVSISEPRPPFKTLKTFELSEKAFSASGLRKGQHIFDPRTAEPAIQKIAAWVLAPKAGEADALSTAFMILSHEEVKRCCAANPSIQAIVIDDLVKDRYVIHEYGFGAK